MPLQPASRARDLGEDVDLGLGVEPGGLKTGTVFEVFFGGGWLTVRLGWVGLVVFCSQKNLSMVDLLVGVGGLGGCKQFFRYQQVGSIKLTPIRLNRIVQMQNLKNVQSSHC